METPVPSLLTEEEENGSQNIGYTVDGASSSLLLDIHDKVEREVFCVETVQHSSSLNGSFESYVVPVDEMEVGLSSIKNAELDVQSQTNISSVDSFYDLPVVVEEIVSESVEYVSDSVKPGIVGILADDGRQCELAAPAPSVVDGVEADLRLCTILTANSVPHRRETESESDSVIANLEVNSQNTKNTESDVLSPNRPSCEPLFCGDDYLVAPPISVEESRLSGDDQCSSEEFSCAEGMFGDYHFAYIADCMYSWKSTFESVVS